MLNQQVFAQASQELRSLVATQCRSACETLFERFPEILSDRDTALEIIYYEYILRQEHDETEHPTAAEFCQRFPEFHEDLIKLFQVDEALGAFQLGGPTSLASHHRGSKLSEASDYADVSNAEPTIGQIGDYRLLQIVGRGGMGMVYRAVQEKLGRVIALKTISLVESLNTSTVSRFRKEAELASSLQHPNIAQIYEVGSQNNVPFFSMEYVPGGSLADAMQSRPLKPEVAASLVAVLARAVNYIHQQGILHRDLKPGNILLSPSQRPEAIAIPLQAASLEVIGIENGVSNEHHSLSQRASLYGFEPKIIDFGLAISINRLQIESSKNQIIGTPSYMSPEQSDPAHGVLGPASDIFSLGAILYQSLVGRPPFHAAMTSEILRQVREDDPISLRHLQPQIPLDLETICFKCLKKSASARYASGIELAEDLHRFLEGKPIHARSASIAEHTFKWSRRNPSAATLVFASVTALAVITWLWRKSESTNLELLRANQQVVESSARADSNLESAKAAVEQYLVTITEDPRVNESDFIDLRKELLESALPFYEKLRDQKPGDLDVERSRAGAFYRLAFIQESTGQDALALANFKEATRMFEGLMASSPSNSACRFSLVKCQIDLGRLFTKLSDQEQAKEEFRKALGNSQSLSDDFPHDAEYRNAVTYCHRNLSSLFREAGDLAAAKRELEQSIAISERLVIEFPDRPECRQYLADGYGNLAMLLNQGQDRASAKKFQSDSLAIRKTLADDFPSKVAYQFRLATAHHNLGLILGDLRERKEAIAQYESALSIYEQVSKAFPNVTLYRSEMAKVHTNLGNLSLDIGDRPKALSHLEKSLAAKMQLVKDFPAVHEYSSILGGGYCNLGRYWMMEDPALALEHYSQAESIVLPLKKLVSQSSSTHSTLRNIYGGKASVLRMLSRYDEAADHWDLAEELDEGKNKAFFHQQSIQCRSLHEQSLWFDDVLAGTKSPPESADECVAFASHCRNKLRYIYSAELYRRALQEKPELAIDHRYNAACSVALALVDGKTSEPDLTPDQKSQWCAQLLDWLQADFDVMPRDALRTKSKLNHWLNDPDLRSVRDSKVLLNLTAADHQSLESFWSRVKHALE